MTSWIPLAGIVVGVLYGLFGVGSAFATPALALVGVPPLTAVVAPLPAFVPSSMAGAWSYARRGKVDRVLAGRVMAGAVPAAVLGAALSPHVGGEALLLLQGAVLLLIGGRLLLPSRRRRRTVPTVAARPGGTRPTVPTAAAPVDVPDAVAVAPAAVTRTDGRGADAVATVADVPDAATVAVAGAAVEAVAGAAYRWSGSQIVGTSVAVGLLSGLLANGGGFLLVPWFMVVLGLDMHRATGTSLLVAAALTAPTLVTHALVGGIDWHVAGPFALGVVPGAALGGWLSQHLPTGRLRTAFGGVLVAVGLRYVLG